MVVEAHDPVRVWTSIVLVMGKGVGAGHGDVE